MLEARNSLFVWSDAKKEKSPSLGDWVTYDRRSSERTPSQRVFRASLDGTRLGWVDEASGDLHVRSRRGKDLTVKAMWHNDWRFSADGKQLAAVTGVAVSDMKVVVLDVDTGEQKDLGHVETTEQIEWTRDGVVIHEWDDGHDRLVYLPLDGGERRTLVEKKNVTRLATASEGTAVYFTRWRKGATHVYQVDVDGGGKPVDIGEMAGRVTNGEVAPDGSRAAFATGKGVYVVADGRVERISKDGDVRSLWFSSDGARLAFASTEQVTVREGDQTYTLEHGEDYFISARFVDGGDKVLLAVGKHVTRWDPATGANQTLATAPTGKTFLAADQFGDSLVVWAMATLVGGEEVVPIVPAEPEKIEGGVSN